MGARRSIQMPSAVFVETFVSRLLVRYLAFWTPGPWPTKPMRWLLEADCRLGGRVSTLGVELLNVAPQASKAWVNEHISALRAWCGNERPASPLPGFSREESLEVADRKFADGLIRFGLDAPGGHVLLALRGPGGHLYNSYHVSATSTLLKLGPSAWPPRSALDRAEQRAADEQQMKDVLSQAVTWTSFPQRAGMTLLGESSHEWEWSRTGLSCHRRSFGRLTRYASGQVVTQALDAH